MEEVKEVIEKLLNDELSKNGLYKNATQHMCSKTNIFNGNLTDPYPFGEKEKALDIVMKDDIDTFNQDEKELMLKHIYKKYVLLREAYAVIRENEKLEKELEESERWITLEEQKEEKDKLSKEIFELHKIICKMKEEKHGLFDKVFQEVCGKVNKSIDDEILRFSNENDLENERSLGYFIGLKKARKIFTDLYIK